MIESLGVAKYEEKLLVKHGVSTMLEPYVSLNTPINHKCLKCGKPYRVSPLVVLYSKKEALCYKCYPRVVSSELEVDFKARLKKKFDYITCTSFTSMCRMATFACSRCGATTEITARKMLKWKDGCACAKVQTLQSISELIAICRKTNPTIEILSKRRESSTSPIKVRCTICEYEWETLNTTKLCFRANKQTNGCIKCFPKGANRFYKYTVKLGTRTVKVQGYEREALDYIQHEKRIKPESISVASEGHVPVIKYEFQKVLRHYYPDILIGKSTIVEVKSEHTLWKDWGKNVAKAKQVEALGFRFVMLVVQADRKTYAVAELPSQWYKEKQDTIKCYVQQIFVPTVRVLAFDPGTTNFGWAALECHVDEPPKLLGCGKLHNRIEVMHDGKIMGDQLQSFVDEIRQLVEEFNINRVIAERFMSRGHGGTTIELVNLMLGGIRTLSLFMQTGRDGLRKSKNTMFITAAQWKNAVSKYVDLRDVYDTAAVETHVVDAILIGIYGCHKWLCTTPFSNLKQFKTKLIQTR